MGATSSRPTHTADHFLYQAAQVVDDVSRTLQRLISNFFALIFSPFSSHARNHLWGNGSTNVQDRVCDDTGICLKPAPRLQQERERKLKADLRMKRAEAAAHGLDPRLINLNLKRTSTNMTTTSTSSKPVAAPLFNNKGFNKEGLKDKVEEEREKLVGKIQIGKEKMVEKIEVEKERFLNKVEEEKLNGENRWKALLNDLHSVDDSTKKPKGDGNLADKHKEKPLWVMGNVKPRSNEENSRQTENVIKHFNQTPTSIAALATANVGLTTKESNNDQLDLKPSHLAANQLSPNPLAPVRKSSKKVKKDNLDSDLKSQPEPEAARATEKKGEKMEQVKEKETEKGKGKEREKELVKPTVEVKVTEPSKFFSPPTIKSDSKPLAPSSIEIQSKETVHQPSNHTPGTKQKVQISPSQIQTSLALSNGIPSHLNQSTNLHARRSSAHDSVTFQVIASSSSANLASTEQVEKPKGPASPIEVIPRTRKSSRTRAISLKDAAVENVSKEVSPSKEEEKKSEAKPSKAEQEEQKQLVGEKKSGKNDESPKEVPSQTVQSSTILHRPIPIRTSTPTTIPPVQTTGLIQPQPKRGQRIQLPVELIERGTAPSPANLNSVRNSLDLQRGITPPPRPASSNSIRSTSSPSPMVLNLLNKAKEAFNDAVNSKDSIDNGHGVPTRAWSPALSTTSSNSSNFNRPKSPATPSFDKVSCLADKACMKKWESSSKERKKWKDEVNKMALYRVQQGQNGALNLNGASNNLNGLNSSQHDSHTIGIGNGVGALSSPNKRRVSAGGAGLGRSNSTNSNRKTGHRRSGSTGTTMNSNSTTHINLKDSTVSSCVPPPSAPSSNANNHRSSSSKGFNGAPIGIGRVQEGVKIESSFTTLAYDQTGLQRRSSGKNQKKSALS